MGVFFLFIIAAFDVARGGRVFYHRGTEMK